MTTLTKPKSTRRACVGCGRSFVDAKRSGAPRSYCDACRAPARKSSAPAARRLRGEPLTLEHFERWARRLRLKGDAKFRLEAWEALYVGDVLDAIAGRASFRQAWLVVPEGNGKSTLTAALVLYLVEFDRDAQIPVAAAARDQAEIIFTQGQGFVRRTPELTGRIRCKPGLREIVHGAARAKIFASDASTGDGVIPWPAAVLDELHRHADLELYRTWSGKLEKQRAVLLVSSTAGEPGSDFEATRELMRQSADTVEPLGPCAARYAAATFVLHEYAVPEGGDTDDLELVAAANPSARVTVETLRAKRADPSFALPHWRRLTCNQPTRTAAAAITERQWAAARDPELDAIPAGVGVWAGLDLGWTHDTTALVPLWAPSVERRVFGRATILVPPADGSQLPSDDVERALVDLHRRNPIGTLVMDMTKGEQLAQWAEDELGIEVVNRSQGNVMKALDYERLMEALRLGTVTHCGDDPRADHSLTRHALNAVARLLPGGDVRFDRPRASRTVGPELQRRRVIDALDAACMVHTSRVGALLEPAAAAVQVEAGVIARLVERALDRLAPETRRAGAAYVLLGSLVRLAAVGADDRAGRAAGRARAVVARDHADRARRARDDGRARRARGRTVNAAAAIFAPVRSAAVGAARGFAALTRMVFPATSHRWLFSPGSRTNYRDKVGDGTGSSTVMAPLLWIARTFPEAPPALWALDDATGQEDHVRAHPMLRLLQRPNKLFTGPTLWMATLTDWHVRGDAYWLKIRSAQGAVVELWWTPSWMLEPMGDDRSLITHYEYRLRDREPLRVDPADVVHFRYGVDPHDPKHGSSPLRSVLREVFTDDEAAAFTATILGNMGVPGVVISPDTDEPLDEADVAYTKEYFSSAFSGDRRGEPLVMTGRTRVEQFGFSPEQLLLRELRRIPEERTTAVLGVPAIVAGLGAGLDRSTFTNYAEARSAAYESTLIPSQRILGEDVRFQLLPEFEDDPFAWRFGFDLSKGAGPTGRPFPAGATARPRRARRMGNRRRGAPRAGARGRRRPRPSVPPPIEHRPGRRVGRRRRRNRPALPEPR
jgi:HK97 family phage portal protein